MKEEEQWQYHVVDLPPSSPTPSIFVACPCGWQTLPHARSLMLLPSYINVIWFSFPSFFLSFFLILSSIPSYSPFSLPSCFSEFVFLFLFDLL